MTNDEAGKLLVQWYGYSPAKAAEVAENYGRGDESAKLAILLAQKERRRKTSNPSRYRVARHRALENAGFVYVKGWVPAKVAAAIQRKIDAALGDVEAAADGPQKAKDE